MAYDPQAASNTPKPQDKAGAGFADDASAFGSLKLAVIAHLFWLVPMVAGNHVFHVGNQGVAELIPLMGLPVAIAALFRAVRGIKGAKSGLAVAGLILTVLAIMGCVAAVVALPGPLQPFLRI